MRGGSIYGGFIVKKTNFNGRQSLIVKTFIFNNLAEVGTDCRIYKQIFSKCECEALMSGVPDIWFTLIYPSLVSIPLLELGYFWPV